jgi:hypothetical protein
MRQGLAKFAPYGSARREPASKILNLAVMLSNLLLMITKSRILE